jgi:hypothetical protein
VRSGDSGSSRSFGHKELRRGENALPPASLWVTNNDAHESIGGPRSVIEGEAAMSHAGTADNLPIKPTAGARPCLAKMNRPGVRGDAGSGRSREPANTAPASLAT